MYFFLKRGIYLSLLALFLSCSSNNSTKDEESMVSLKSTTPIITTEQNNKTQNNQHQKIIDNQNRKNEIKKSAIDEIFQNSTDLLPNGKYMIMLFESENCSYCTKLKEDILNNKELKDKIKNNFSAYKLSLDENQIYNFLYRGEIVKADTNLLKSIYSINSTPTLLFDDKDAKNILIISGYIPPEQLNATLDFIQEGLWQGKDRKNGEVYKALEEYYQKRGLVEQGKIETH